MIANRNVMPKPSPHTHPWPSMARFYNAALSLALDSCITADVFLRHRSGAQVLHNALIYDSTVLQRSYCRTFGLCAPLCLVPVSLHHCPGEFFFFFFSSSAGVFLARMTKIYL